MRHENYARQRRRLGQPSLRRPRDREFGFEIVQRLRERVVLPPGLRGSLGQSKQTPDAC
jgi:hypothetical protein